MAEDLENEDLFGIRDLPLDDAMIKYMADGSAYINNEHSWIEFKMFHECPETAAVLFARFWDVIMPNIKTYKIVQDTPRMADQLSLIHNPRTHPPPPPKVYANVEKMSLFEHEKIRNKERQRKRFNDPGMVALKKKSMNYLNSVRAKEATTQSSRNSRSSLHSVDQSILDQTVRQSLTSSRLSQGSTNDTTMPRVNQSSIELVDRQSLGPIRRVGLNSTSTATVSDQTGADSSAETISDDEIPRKRLRSVDGE